MANSRHTGIVELLSERGEVSVQELAERFDVSTMTIRRDLATLERSGRLTRTHGGAVLSQAGIIEFSLKENEMTFQKRAIARAVAQMVKPGMAISLDTGTTTLEVARAIAGTPGLTVLTSSLAVASALYARDNIELVLLGGTVRRGNPDLSGWLTEENVRKFRADLALLGADGVDQSGAYTVDVGVARVSQAVLSHARRAVLVADHTKFGKTAFVKYADLGDIHSVVTDAGTGRAVRAWLRQAVQELIVAN